jgi:hypothetical protein
MRTREKIMFSVLGLLIFFISGGVACTYSTAGSINLGLAVTLGLLVFITAGATACTYTNSKIAKRKEPQVAN